jgi:hypothetical protein
MWKFDDLAGRTADFALIHLPAKNPATEKFFIKKIDGQDSVGVKLNCRSAGMTSTHMAVREALQPGKAPTMSFIAEIVRRATRLNVEQPKARVRGKSPRARLRCEALSMLA